MTTFLGTATGTTHAVQGDTTIATANGIVGTSTTGRSAIWGTTSGQSSGVYGDANHLDGYGVFGINYAGAGTGVRGVCDAYMGTGVEGSCSDPYWGYGVTGTAKYGVGGYASAANGYGIRGSDGSFIGALAGYFSGDVHVNGSVVKGGGTFLIDHPLDPENKLLAHSFVESPERKNVYDGVAQADPNGECDIQMPPYFDALNQDFRYQLTAVGAPAPMLHVAEEIRGGRFKIAGAAAGQRISWQVTGIRKDAWAVANPLVVEAEKADDERGFFLYPEVLGFGFERSIDCKRYGQHHPNPSTPPKP